MNHRLRMQAKRIAFLREWLRKYSVIPAEIMEMGDKAARKKKVMILAARYDRKRDRLAVILGMKTSAGLLKIMRKRGLGVYGKT